MEVAMEIGEISLLSIVTAVAPMALFVLLALFAPLVYRRIAGKLIKKFRPHQPQWISIILDSYLRTDLTQSEAQKEQLAEALKPLLA